ncbi:MAG: UbiA prenyltransferase family protein [Bacteroidaceae bacterium]|nr:UbiA prenyltransferase family protein [Bacteroidaceae bacterium]
MNSIIKLLRPAQWLKNTFIFLPIFFNQRILSFEELASALCTFIAFSFAASSIYCFNDIRDAEADKLHPKKRMRPIASGKITLVQAYTTMVACFIIALVLLYLLPAGEIRNKTSFGIIIYYILNICYCTTLKHFAIIDTFIIAIGFVIRILVGGFSTATWTSQWIVLMTFLLALFLAFAKRRDDVLIFQTSGTKMRKNIVRYNLTFLNNAIAIIAAMTMICYIMWTMEDDVIERFNTQYLYITSIFVLLGIMRYMQLTIVDEKSGSPTNIMRKDRFIHLCIAGWITAFTIIIYL